MTGSLPFWSLVRHDLKLRRTRNCEERFRPQRWVFTFPSAIVWFLVLTWQGPHIHFNLNDGWYATLALPFMALGLARREISQERDRGTVGWWLTLPMPRHQLVLAKWIATLGLTVRRSTYLLLVAALGIYTMILNGTFSGAHVTHFLLTGLTWTALMYCLVPATAGLGILIGVLSFSRLRDLSWALWLLVVAVAWVPASHPNWYVTVSSTLRVTARPLFPLIVLGTWIAGACILWVASLVLDRATGL